MKKIETTKNIAVHTELRVYKKGFGYSKLEVIENNDYYLAAIAEGDFFGAVAHGDDLEAYIWVEDIASYEFKLKVIGMIITEPKILFFQHTEEIVWSSERKCLAAQVDIPIHFFVFNPGESEKSISTERIVFRHGNIILLQDREAVIKSDNDIEDEVFLKGHLKMNGEDTEIVGKVTPLNRDKQIYSVIFTGMSDKDRHKLLDYIFSTYRE